MVSKIYLSPPMASSIVCSKAVVLLLFIHYLLWLPLFVGFFCELDICFYDKQIDLKRFIPVHELFHKTTK